jgi:two-component system cell cycle response regulator
MEKMARVLVIEDNPASLDLLVYLLRAFGHTPLSARDGVQGLAAAQSENPDLILCDIQLPGVDGLEVCRQLKADPVLRKVPLVAVTAYAMVGDREKLLMEGFDGYLSKPINPATFIAEMAPYLHTTQADFMEKFAQDAVPSVKPTNGTILVVDNSPVNVRLAHSILEPFGYSIIEARSVDEAMVTMAKCRPDLILSDIHMPVKDGFDLIRAVKADDELRLIPFVFISSTVWGDHERNRALSLGADRFLIRPIEPHALVAELESCRVHPKGA